MELQRSCCCSRGLWRAQIAGLKIVRSFPRSRSYRELLFFRRKVCRYYRTSGYLIQILEVISHSGYLYWHGKTFCKECPAGKFGLPLYLHSFRHSVILHEVGILRLLKNLYCAATFFVNEWNNPLVFFHFMSV